MIQDRMAERGHGVNLYLILIPGYCSHRPGKVWQGTWCSSRSSRGRDQQWYPWRRDGRWVHSEVEVDTGARWVAQRIEGLDIPAVRAGRGQRRYWASHRDSVRGRGQIRHVEHRHNASRIEH